MSLKKLAGPFLAVATALGASGCATTGHGGPTMTGAVLGGAVGRVVSDNPAAVIGGAVIGGIVGNSMERDCYTRTNSTLRRTVNGNATGQWRGSETMNTNCQYDGNNPPANLNAPQHMQHLQRSGPRPSPWRGE